jgi:hypothetical protein
MKNFLDLVFQAHSSTAVCSIVTDTLTYNDTQRTPDIPGLKSLSELLTALSYVTQNASLVEAISMGHTVAENSEGISYCKRRNFDLLIGSEVC